VTTTNYCYYYVCRIVLFTAPASAAASSGWVEGRVGGVYQVKKTHTTGFVFMSSLLHHWRVSIVQTLILPVFLVQEVRRRQQLTGLFFIARYRLQKTGTMNSLYISESDEPLQISDATCCKALITEEGAVRGLRLFCTTPPATFSCCSFVLPLTSSTPATQQSLPIIG
jgi:hypothetical protein